jgi:uncharacterized protein
VSGAAQSTISFLSSIANREAIAFGEALATPMRLMFETVAASKLPGSHIYENQAKLAAGGAGVPLETVVNRMRLIAEPEKDEEYNPEAEMAPRTNIPAPSLDGAPVRRFTGVAENHRDTSELRPGLRQPDVGIKPLFGGR